MDKIYVCIDLKSFYASVECVERELDPITTNLVVADNSRTEKTICLAVTPSLKQYGLSGRSRLFEVVRRVNMINRERRQKIKRNFVGKSFNNVELNNNPYLELDYIIATPRMKLYMKYSTDIYHIYLKYFSSEDIYVYSIDEVFIDITNYLDMYNMGPREIVTKIIRDVYDTTGITATAGIGTNLYLAKVGMDIVAKHVEPNEFGVRIAGLDEMYYRKKLWNHRPLTDFWRVGKGYAKKLEDNNMYTMGDIARCSIENENLLFKLFGVNAELLIDHAWGWEPCSLKDIKLYKPVTNSLSSGQVLHEAYDYNKTKLIVKEMVELLTLDMVEKNYVTNGIVLDIGYDIDNLMNTNYNGEITKDYYGRKVPKPAHGTIRIDHHTSSTKIICDKTMELFEKIINKKLHTRRINITVCNLVHENDIQDEVIYQQLDLFSNNIVETKMKEEELKDEMQERKVQRAIIDIKKKYGKNAILKAMNLEEGGTTIERNNQVGGHKG